MANAAKDNNGVPTLIGASSADGSTPVRVKVDAGTNIIQTDDDTTGSDLSGDVAGRDDNGVPFLMGVSEVDGVTPVEIYVNASGELLIDST